MRSRVGSWLQIGEYPVNEERRMLRHSVIRELPELVGRAEIIEETVRIETLCPFAEPRPIFCCIAAVDEATHEIPISDVVPHRHPPAHVFVRRYYFGSDEVPFGITSEIAVVPQFDSDRHRACVVAALFSEETIHRCAIVPKPNAKLRYRLGRDSDRISEAYRIASVEAEERRPRRSINGEWPPNTATQQVRGSTFGRPLRRSVIRFAGAKIEPEQV